MKKSDLKYKNVVELRNGDFYVLVKAYNKSVLITLKGKYHLSFDDYYENLTHISGCVELDIMKVYKDYTCTELLWERKEKQKPKLTEDEKVILRNVPKQYEWIARDAGDSLCVYTKRPIKQMSVWSTDGWMSPMPLFYNLFQFIKWEDEEPYSIEDLLGKEK